MVNLRLESGIASVPNEGSHKLSSTACCAIKIAFKPLLKLPIACLFSAPWRAYYLGQIDGISTVSYRAFYNGLKAILTAQLAVELRLWCPSFGAL